MAKQKRLGEMLIERGFISEVQLNHALERQKRMGGRLGSLLVNAGIIKESELLKLLALKTGTKEVNLRKFKPDPQIMKKVPEKIAMQYVVLPLVMKGKTTLVLACVDPTDLNMLDELSFITGHSIQPVIASYSAILTALQHYYSAVPLADSRPLHGTNDSSIELGSQGAGHPAVEDPDLIIFGEQTNPGITKEEIYTNAPPAARPLTRPISTVAHPAAKVAKNNVPKTDPVINEDTEDVSLEFHPIGGGEEEIRVTKKKQDTSFTKDERLIALYRVMIKKGIITEKEIEDEIVGLRKRGILK